MTWGSFLLALAAVYAVYYGINIVYDLLNAGGSAKKSEVLQLAFEDDVVAKDTDGIGEPWPRDPPDLARETDDGDEPGEQASADGGETEAASPTGGLMPPMADSFVSGGIAYAELLKQAVRGAITLSSRMDFGEA